MAEAVAELSAAGADQIKVMASGLVGLDDFGRIGPVQFETEDLRYLIEQARTRGLPVMAHANGAEAVTRCIEAGVSSVEHGYFMGPEAFGASGGMHKSPGFRPSPVWTFWPNGSPGIRPGVR